MKSFFVSLCIVLVAYGAVQLIKNSGAAAKMTRFVFSLALLCSVISVIPFADFDSISFSLPASTQLLNEELSEAAFKEAVSLMLTEEGIEFEKLTVYSSKNEDGSINIEEIRVKGASNTDKAKELIRQNTGIEKIEVS